MDACSCSRWVLIDVAQSFRTITCFPTLISIHVISQPSTHYGSPYQVNLHFMLIALRIHHARSVTNFAADLRSTYDSRFRYSCSAYDADTLRFRCLRLFATASRFRRLIPACIYHPRRSLGFYDFTSIDTTLSAYHNHRRCDFHPRLRFRPAIGLTRSTRYFNRRFWPAIGPAIWAAGLPLAFAADSSIRNQRIDRLPWASIPATIAELPIRSLFRTSSSPCDFVRQFYVDNGGHFSRCLFMHMQAAFGVQSSYALGLTASHSIPLQSSRSPFGGTTIAALKASASL
jgi:hypothetical protein